MVKKEEDANKASQKYRETPVEVCTTCQHYVRVHSKIRFVFEGLRYEEDFDESCGLGKFTVKAWGYCASHRYPSKRSGAKRK